MQSFLKKLQKKTAEQPETQEVVKEKKQLSINLSSEEIAGLRLTKPDPEVEIELKRMGAYIERPTQKLLRNLLENRKESEVLPTYDPSFGFRYRTVESAFIGDVSPGEIEEFLERLYRLEILEKRFFDSVSACPVCGSTCITLHCRCPKCTSRHIVKTGLTEHVPCGNIDERDRYNQGHLVPTCPKCGARLVEGEYRDMGLWYICRECGERFEHPNLDLICRKCENKFTVQTAIVREISKYFLNPNREKEIKQNVTSLESISGLLSELGFAVNMSASVIGEKSGIEHIFSLMAKKSSGDREYVVAIDHAVGDTEVGVSPLILYVYKISEVKIDLPIFVAIPKLSETARRIAEGNNLLVIESIPQEKEQLDMLHDEIEKRLGERIAEERIIEIPPPPPPEPEITHERVIRYGRTVEIWRDRKGRFVKNPESSPTK